MEQHPPCILTSIICNPIAGHRSKRPRRDADSAFAGSAAPHGALGAVSAAAREARPGPARPLGPPQGRHGGRSAALVPPHPAAAPRSAARPARPGRPLREGGVPEAQGGRARRGPALPAGMGGKCPPPRGAGTRRGPAGRRAGPGKVRGAGRSQLLRCRARWSQRSFPAQLILSARACSREERAPCRAAECLVTPCL